LLITFCRDCKLRTSVKTEGWVTQTQTRGGRLLQCGRLHPNVVHIFLNSLSLTQTPITGTTEFHKACTALDLTSIPCQMGQYCSTQAASYYSYLCKINKMPSLCRKTAQGINQCLHETAQDHNPLDKLGGNVKLQKKPINSVLWSHKASY